MGMEVEMSGRLRRKKKKKDDDDDLTSADEHNNNNNNDEEIERFLPKENETKGNKGGGTTMTLSTLRCFVFVVICFIASLIAPSSSSTSHNSNNNEKKKEDYIPHFDPIHSTQNQPPPGSNNSDDDFFFNVEDSAQAILQLRQASLEQMIAPLLLPSSTSTHTSHPQKLLHDLSTPYGQAFSFLLLYDARSKDYFLQSSAQHEEELIERFVATLLFYSTGGDEVGAGVHRFSFNSTENQKKGGGGWHHGNLHFLSSLHICHWNKKLRGMNVGFGLLNKVGEYMKSEEEEDLLGIVKCNEKMEVTHINLVDNNLLGTIPPEIKHLTKLQSLDVRNNRISGPIPEEIGELQDLTFLSLDGNKFTGSIPDSLGNLDNLESIYLNFNDISGTVPDSICSLRKTNKSDNGGGGGVLQDLWADCGRWPVDCKCCTVCCDILSECDEVKKSSDDTTEMIAEEDADNKQRMNDDGDDANT